MVSQIISCFEGVHASQLSPEVADPRLNILTNFENELPNLHKWWRIYQQLNGDANNFSNILLEVDIPAWTSGLACGKSDLCATAFKALTSTSTDMPSLSTEQVQDMKHSVDRTKGKYCPPNCGCDNPWGFLG
jgi:hypothetical protein